MTAARTAVILAATAALVGMLALVALAQPYPPPEPLVEVDVTVVNPGATIRISGRNWGPGTTVEIIRPGEGSAAASGSGAGNTSDPARGAPMTFASVPVAEDGTFATEVTLPPDVEPGSIELRATGHDADARPQHGTVTLDVRPGTPEPATAGVPRGAVLAGAVLLLLIAAGGAWWRRRQAAA